MDRRFHNAVISMKHRHSKVAFAVIALVFVFSSHGAAQNSSSRSSPEQKVLHLNGANNGQHVTARVDQTIEITLQTIGPGHYGTAEISSSAVRFESAVFPKEQIPGGPRQVYRFRAASEGAARVKIPHVLQVVNSDTAEIKDFNPAFAITIRVQK